MPIRLTPLQTQKRRGRTSQGQSSSSRGASPTRLSAEHAVRFPMVRRLVSGGICDQGLEQVRRRREQQGSMSVHSGSSFASGVAPKYCVLEPTDPTYWSPPANACRATQQLFLARRNQTQRPVPVTTAPGRRSPRQESQWARLSMSFLQNPFPLVWGSGRGPRAALSSTSAGP
jgi:hypothetical protein